MYIRNPIESLIALTKASACDDGIGRHEPGRFQIPICQISKLVFFSLFQIEY